MTVLIGSGDPDVALLASALSADLEVTPDLGPADSDWAWAADLDRWRDDLSARRRDAAVVVAPWASRVEPCGFVDTGFDTWLAHGEHQLALWLSALTAATRCCEDGGAVVAVVDRLAVLDSAGLSLLAMVGDGVEVIVRSLARGEGHRRVRVNAVTTPARWQPPSSLSPPVPLATFPGSLDEEVAGAIRQLLDGGAAGLTGRVIDVDCGRSWR